MIPDIEVIKIAQKVHDRLVQRSIDAGEQPGGMLQPFDALTEEQRKPVIGAAYETIAVLHEDGWL